MYDQNNIFAQILRGEAPCYKVYEDVSCLAFMDIFPINPGHMLVIPKKEITSVIDLDGQTMADLMWVAKKLAKALRQSEIRCEGVNFWLSDGASAGQEVPHVHLHIIPRFQGDGFGWKLGPHNRQCLASLHLEELKTQVQEALYRL